MSFSRTLLVLLIAQPTVLLAQVPVEPATPKVKVVVAESYYPGNDCLVRDKPIKKGKAVVKEINGRTVKLCCAMCVKKLEKDPKTYLAKLDRKIAAAQRASYPLKVCAISGGVLGGMGKPHEIVVNGRLIRLCCAGCEKKARKDVAAITSRLVTALAASKGDGAAKCPVSGKPIKAGKGINFVYGNEVVRLCCAACVKKYVKTAGEGASKEPHHEHNEHGQTKKKTGHVDKH